MITTDGRTSASARARMQQPRWSRMFLPTAALALSGLSRTPSPLRPAPCPRTVLAGGPRRHAELGGGTRAVPAAVLHTPHAQPRHGTRALELRVATAGTHYCPLRRCFGRHGARRTRARAPSPVCPSRPASRLADPTTRRRRCTPPDQERAAAAARAMTVPSAGRADVRPPAQTGELSRARAHPKARPRGGRGRALRARARSGQT